MRTSEKPWESVNHALGGAVSFLIFLGILFVGVTVRVSQPLIQLLRP